MSRSVQRSHCTRGRRCWLCSRHYNTEGPRSKRERAVLAETVEQAGDLGDEPLERYDDSAYNLEYGLNVTTMDRED